MMPIRRRPELDIVNPPGQTVYHMEKPLVKNIEDFLGDTEDAFCPSQAYRPVHGGYPGHVDEGKEDNKEEGMNVVHLASFVKDQQSE